MKISTEKKERTEPTIVPSVKKRDSISIPLPKNMTPILVGLLIVASFFLGMLVTKVQYLEKNNTTAVAVNAAAQPTQALPRGNQQPQAPVKANVDVGHFPIKGNDNAKVTIVAFEDFRCPFCKKFSDEVMPQLQKDYIDTGKVKFYYRNYQFLGPASVTAGNAAECANVQGKFWEFHDYLYKNQPSESDTSLFTSDSLTQIAGQLGIDTTQFKSCLDSKKYDKNVSDDMAAGQKAQTTATPTFYINGNQLVGAQPYTAFQTIIDQELKK